MTRSLTRALALAASVVLLRPWGADVAGTVEVGAVVTGALLGGALLAALRNRPIAAQETR